jgi:hypothetical protein
MGRHFVNIILSFLPPSRLFFFRRLCLRIVGIRMGQGVSFCGRGAETSILAKTLTNRGMMIVYMLNRRNKTLCNQNYRRYCFYHKS